MSLTRAEPWVRLQITCWPPGIESIQLTLYCFDGTSEPIEVLATHQSENKVHAHLVRTPSFTCVASGSVNGCFWFTQALIVVPTFSSCTPPVRTSDIVFTCHSQHPVHIPADLDGARPTLILIVETFVSDMGSRLQNNCPVTAVHFGVRWGKNVRKLDRDETSARVEGESMKGLPVTSHDHDDH